MLTIKEALTTLYSEILESYYKENELYRLRNSMTFYEFIEVQLEKYKRICSEIDIKKLETVLEENFKGECNERRFMDLINIIIELHKKILQSAYKGDLQQAYIDLKRLIGESIKDELPCEDSPLNNYLDDSYHNCISRKLKTDKLYRMRDVGESEYQPKDCWHVPFVLRKHASFQRYNMYGIPTLYLTDSLETADAELGELKSNKNRWYSEFSINEDENKWKDYAVYDFTAISKEQIEEEDSGNFLLYWLLTYPLRLLCSIKVYDKGNFCEEYIFPQLIFHWMYFSRNGCMNGFMYSSTKNPGGINYVFPARYEGDIPPTHKDKQISTELEKLFKASEPKLYKKGKEKKKYSIEIAEI